MLWYNRQTGVVQSMPPWGSSFMHPMLQVELYPNWEEVSDDFAPPVPENVQETKSTES